MAKTAKPNFKHASHAVKVSPAAPDPRRNDPARRKRMAKRGRWDNLVENMTKIRWEAVITAMSNGGTRAEAAKKAGISEQTIDAYLISNISAYKQLRDASLLWIRRDWSSDLIEHIFDDLALGLTLKAAALKNGMPAAKLSQLYRLVRKDKQIREAYDDARELQAESFLDEVIDIADDSENDRLENGRINHEVVNRSKLRIDTRKYAMGSMVKKRFGDTKHIDIDGGITMNHIATLTGARKRLEKVRPSTPALKEPVGEIIEGEVAEA